MMQENVRLGQKESELIEHYKNMIHNDTFINDMLTEEPKNQRIAKEKNMDIQAFTIRVPKELHKKIKTTAIEQEKTLCEFVTDALTETIKKQQDNNKE